MAKAKTTTETAVETSTAIAHGEKGEKGAKGAKGAKGVIANPFDVAKPLAAVTAKKGKQRDEVEIEGISLLAALQVLLKSIEGEAEILQKQVKEKSIERFVQEMLRTGKRPDSFVGTEDIAEASCEMRKRGSNLAVSEETARRLEASGIALDRKVKVPERFVFNPELTQDQLKIIGEVLATNSKTKGMTIVSLQPEESYFVAGEETLDQLAATHDETLIRETVESAAVFAVGKFKLDCADPKAMALEIAKRKGVL